MRGLPVATGGAPFVQLQEDGLPVVLFGDIQFGNNDYWTRFDATTATVEAVRGGSATTLASQAPGAVINYISHTGAREGGYLQLSKGIDYNDTKVDFRYGGPLGEDMSFHIGGFFQRGEDQLGVGYTINDSVQVKGNFTKDFADGESFLRLYFKVADTQGINYTGAPALADFDGSSVNNIRAFPGFDGRSQTNYSIFNQSQLILNREGVFERVPINGISTNQKYIGAQLHYVFGDNFTLDNLRHFGALKAMGAGDGLLLRMILLQAFAVGAIGYGLGVGLASLVGWMASGTELAFRLPWQLLVLSAGAVTFICLVSAALAIHRVVRLEPAIVFRS